MKKFLNIFLFFASIIFGYYYIVDFETTTKDFSKEKIISETDSIITVSLNIVGDLMCHSVQIKYAFVENDSLDFNGIFKEIKKYLADADFTVGNFETVLAGKNKGFSGYPYFNAPDEFLYAIKNTGFDLLITANNHALDKGINGIKRTIQMMDRLELKHTGTFVSENDRDSIRIYAINGIKLGVLAYSYGTNGITIPKGMNYIINLIDFDLIKSDIEKARGEGAEIVLVFYHFGEEYQREPNSFQKEVVNKTIAAGADIIIGSHPHVIQPVDFFPAKNGRLDTGFVAYSLGNFISNQRWRYSDATVMLKLELSKNTFSDSIYLSKVSYLPAWVYKGNTTHGNEYIILPQNVSYGDSLYYYLNQSDKKKMEQSFYDTQSILKKYTSRIELLIP